MALDKKPKLKKEAEKPSVPAKGKTSGKTHHSSEQVVYKQRSKSGFPEPKLRVTTNIMLEDREYTLKQLNRVLFALDAFKKGDISVRLPKEEDDIFADIAEAY